jgi:hypothetical protein
MEEMHEARYRGVWSSMPALGSTPSKHFNVFTYQEVLETSFRGFYGGVISQVWLTKSLALGS